jgi:hypothetical protein
MTNSAVKNPLVLASLFQAVGLIVSHYRGCLDEGIVASVLFWALAIKLACRRPYTKVDICVIRYGLVFLFGIVLVIWGR